VAEKITKMPEKLPDELPKGMDWKAFTPDDSPKTPIDVLSDPEHQKLATPDLAPGDPAFDFDLEIHDFSDGTKKLTGERFHLLGEAKSRPVALIFGSYT
jgi:hypothetical protein